MADNSATAKAKAIYGSFLKKQDYDNLIHRNSISSAVAYLKSTRRYAEVFSEADEFSIHRGQVETILSELVFKDYIRMKKFGSEKKDGFLNFFIKKTEADLLIKAVAAIKTNSQQDYFLSFPPYFMDYMFISPVAAASCKDYKELISIIGNNKTYKPLIHILKAENPDLNRCVTVINSCYLKWAFNAIDKEFKGDRNKLLKKFLLRKIDTDNVLLCYRLKKFFDADDESINNLMLPYRYKVKQEDIDNALKSQNPTAALINLLSERCLKRDMSVDEDFPELSALKGDYKFFRHSLAISRNEAEAVFSLMILAENERMNIQKIIEGIRYNELPSDIEKLVII